MLLGISVTSVNETYEIDLFHQIPVLKDTAKSMQSITIRSLQIRIRIQHAKWAYVDRHDKNWMQRDEDRNNHRHKVIHPPQSICDSTNGWSTTISIQHREQLFWANYSHTMISYLKWINQIYFGSDSSKSKKKQKNNSKMEIDKIIRVFSQMWRRSKIVASNFRSSQTIHELFSWWFHTNLDQRRWRNKQFNAMSHH